MTCSFTGSGSQPDSCGSGLHSQGWKSPCQGASPLWNFLVDLGSPWSGALIPESLVGPWHVAQWMSSHTLKFWSVCLPPTHPPLHYPDLFSLPWGCLSSLSLHSQAWVTCCRTRHSGCRGSKPLAQVWWRKMLLDIEFRVGWGWGRREMGVVETPCCRSHMCLPFIPASPPFLFSFRRTTRWPNGSWITLRGLVVANGHAWPVVSSSPISALDKNDACLGPRCYNPFCNCGPPLKMECRTHWGGTEAERHLLPQATWEHVCSHPQSWPVSVGRGILSGAESLPQASRETSGLPLGPMLNSEL